MSSSDESDGDKPVTLEVIFEKEVDSSEEPPMEEWSSLNFEAPEENIKRIKYEEGLYCPGSGEICAQYIPLSDSFVFRHPYYNYPSVLDPGIKEALLNPEPRVIYPDDGQELYLALCREMNLCPIRSFHKQLLEEEVNLKYYGIQPTAFRAIAIALKNNRFVSKLDLTDNWISEDGCFHLGEMFVENITLRELNLHGCRIGPEGARRLLHNLHHNRALIQLDLTKNKLGDAGVEFLAKSIFMGADLRDINLCYNDLTPNAITALCEAFETHNKLSRLDLSWNSIQLPSVIGMLCNKLFENTNLQELNLAWNSLGGLPIAKAMKVLMGSLSLRKLLLNNNKFSSDAIKPLVSGILNSKGLITLDLSFNPLSPDDARRLLSTLKFRKVKLQNLLLDNVTVTHGFLKLKDELLALKHRKNTVVTWGDVIAQFVPKVIDIREIMFDRINAICKKSKKRKVDIALILLALYKISQDPINVQQFSRALKMNNVYLDEDLMGVFASQFAGPVVAKAKTVDLSMVVDYLKRKWPEKKLPPTPPPEEAPPPPRTKKAKNKKTK